MKKEPKLEPKKEITLEEDRAKAKDSLSKEWEHFLEYRGIEKFNDLSSEKKKKLIEEFEGHQLLQIAREKYPDLAGLFIESKRTGKSFTELEAEKKEKE